jgi:hypothetical protein
MDTLNATDFTIPAATPSAVESYGIELTVNGYPPSVEGGRLLTPDGQSWVKMAGPWHETLDVSFGPYSSYQEIPLQLHKTPGEQIRVALENVRHAQPGWIGGRMRLLSAHGEELGSQRPFLLYARACSIATYTYFTDTHPAVDGTFSVGLRVTREP